MDETAKAWKQLSPEDFDNLVFSLLNRKGYMNSEWHGRVKEYVRDIVCYRFTVDGPPELFQKYVAMCKHDKESLTKYRLNKDLEQVRRHSPYCVIIAANLEVSDYKKRLIKNLGNNEENPFQILLWERPELLEMIEEFQDLRWHFFGAEIDDLHKLPGIRNVLARCNIERLSDRLYDLLKHAYRACLQHGRVATIAALLASFMEKEDELINIMAAGNQQLREEMKEFIEEVNSDQTESGFPERAIKLTDSFVKTMILGNRLFKELQRPNLDEKVFLYSLLKISDSETVRLLNEKLSPDTVQSMEGALFCNIFDIDEQDHLKRFFIDCSKDRDLMLSDVDRSLGEDLELENLDFCLDVAFEQGALDKKDMAVDDPDTVPYGPGQAASPETRAVERDKEAIETYRGKIVIEPGDEFDPKQMVSAAAANGFRRREIARLAASYNYFFDMNLDNWFSRLISQLLAHHKTLTDIFIFPEKPVQIRSEGQMTEVELESYPTSFSHFQTEAIACMLLNKAIEKNLLPNTGRKKAISFTYQMKGHQYFRVTILAHAVGMSISFRKSYPPLWSGEKLFFNDPRLSTLREFSEGIVVVAGKPGSGKTTLLNAMVNAVNQGTNSTIVTLENPIETFHIPSGSSVMQLQKGVHFIDYKETAQFSMKSGTDLIVIDELRDADTCQACIDSARSGLLSAATINARTCREAFDRMLYLAGAEGDRKLAAYLATAVKRIICLNLKRNETEEYRAAFEVVDLAREIDEAGSAGNPDSAAPGGEAQGGLHRIEERIDAAFSRTTLEEPGP